MLYRLETRFKRLIIMEISESLFSELAFPDKLCKNTTYSFTTIETSRKACSRLTDCGNKQLRWRKHVQRNKTSFLPFSRNLKK